MKILASLLCAALLVGCNATTGGDVSLKTKAPAMPEVAEKEGSREDVEIENAFIMHLPMMCAKSEDFLERLAQLGEKPMVIWNTRDGQGTEVLQMMFVHPSKKETSVLGFINVTDGTQIACMMSSGHNTEFYLDAIQKYGKIPKEKTLKPGSWQPAKISVD